MWEEKSDGLELGEEMWEDNVDRVEDALHVDVKNHCHMALAFQTAIVRGEKTDDRTPFP